MPLSKDQITFSIKTKIILIAIILLLITLIIYFGYTILTNNSNENHHFKFDENNLIYVYIPKEMASSANQVYFQGNVTYEVIKDDPLFLVKQHDKTIDFSFEVKLKDGTTISENVKTLTIPEVKYNQLITNNQSTIIHNKVNTFFLNGNEEKLQEIINTTNPPEIVYAFTNIDDLLNAQKIEEEFKPLKKTVNLNEEKLNFVLKSKTSYKGELYLVKNGETIKKTSINVLAGTTIQSVDFTDSLIQNKKFFFENEEYKLILLNEDGYVKDMFTFKNFEEELEINFKELENILSNQRTINLSVNEKNKIGNTLFVLNDEKLFKNYSNNTNITITQTDTKNETIPLDKISYALENAYILDRQALKYKINKKISKDEEPIVEFYLNNQNISNSSDIVLRSQRVLEEKFDKKILDNLIERGILIKKPIILNITIDASNIDYNKEYSIPFNIELTNFLDPNPKNIKMTLQVTKPGLILVAENSGDEELLKLIAQQKNWDYTFVPTYTEDAYLLGEPQKLRGSNWASLNISYFFQSDHPHSSFYLTGDELVIPFMLNKNKILLFDSFDENYSNFYVYSSEEFFQKELSRKEILLENGQNIENLYNHNGVLNVTPTIFGSNHFFFDNEYNFQYLDTFNLDSDKQVCSVTNRTTLTCLENFELKEKDFKLDIVEYEINLNDKNRTIITFCSDNELASEINSTCSKTIDTHIVSAISQKLEYKSQNFYTNSCKINKLNLSKNEIELNKENYDCSIKFYPRINFDEKTYLFNFTKKENSFLFNYIDFNYWTLDSLNKIMRQKYTFDLDNNLFFKSGENDDGEKIFQKIIGLRKNPTPNTKNENELVLNKKYEDTKKIILQAYNKSQFKYLFIIGDMSNIAGYFSEDDVIFDPLNGYILDPYYYGSTNTKEFVNLSVGRIPQSDLSFVFDYLQRDLYKTTQEKTSHFYYPDFPYYSSVFIPEENGINYPAIAKIFPKILQIGQYSDLGYASVNDTNYSNLTYFNNPNYTFYLAPKNSKELLINEFITKDKIIISTHGEDNGFVINYTNLFGKYTNLKKDLFEDNELPIMNNSPIIFAESCSTSNQLGKKALELGAAAYIGNYDVAILADTVSGYSQDNSIGDLVRIATNHNILNRRIRNSKQILFA
ncbi:MAG: hypothetical protein PHX27_03725, partial [Candidatus ainarchaeum sp.]|nr:hypothetical protein [Candidatus ainarchaeum sp.]